MLYPGERCERVLAHVPACVAMVDPLVKGFKCLRKKAVLRSNRDLFRRLDILVVAEVAILLLTDEAGLGHVKFVRTRHGAGDRAVSSRSPMGKAVLDFFKNNTDYNLIFAPHVILYQRRGRHSATVARLSNGAERPHRHRQARQHRHNLHRCSGHRPRRRQQSGLRVSTETPPVYPPERAQRRGMGA